MIQPADVVDDNAKDKYEEVLSQDERDLEVVLLKNRYGALGKAYFKFLAKFNLFSETIKPKPRKVYQLKAKVTGQKLVTFAFSDRLQL